MIAALCLALAGFTTALLWAELTQNDRAKFVFKPLASAAFIGLAVACGALDSFYGQLIFIALIFCAIGDACLLPQGTGSWFRRGVMAFFAGHVVYIIALVSLWLGNFMTPRQWLVLPILFLIFFRMYKQLRGRRGDALIELYTGVIITMVAASILAGIKTGLWLPAVAALAFAISDIFVGQNRNGPKPSPRQFWIITPLYFAAQGLFALSILHA